MAKKRMARRQFLSTVGGGAIAGTGIVGIFSWFRFRELKRDLQELTRKKLELIL